MKTEKNKLLSVEHLKVAFDTENGEKEVVHGISFDVAPGEIVGIVGESGSGKSVTAMSVLGLLAKGGTVTGGSIFFEGKKLVFTEEALCHLRGNEIAYIFQEPMTSLNPVLTIQKQMEEVLLLHDQLSASERKSRMESLLCEVGLTKTEEILASYPHELSGGMRQRVMIAMAMLCSPRLLIADEPTTALDVSVQEKVLALLKEMNEKHGTAILFISHDLLVVKSLCDRVVVMNQGFIEEAASVSEIYYNPQKEYTKHLLEASKEIHGESAFLKETCSDCGNPILKVKDYHVFYREKKKSVFSRTKKKEVVHGVDFCLYPGEILGIVGESGCGKSSLIKAIAGLNPLVEGEITPKMPKVRMVFQDPYSSLNPAKTIGWLLEEPLKLSGRMSKYERRERVTKMLETVGLSAEYARRYPNELSGGQRQRVAIAMAVILNQDIILLDEPVSSLDVTVQAQILKLLLKLREEFKLSYIFVSHDMGVVQKICNRVAVMYDGKIVEINTTKEIFKSPKHPYTVELIGAVPLPFYNR